MYVCMYVYVYICVCMYVCMWYAVAVSRDSYERVRQQADLGEEGKADAGCGAQREAGTVQVWEEGLLE